jgi:hemerythrin-like domain-containing protein
MAAVPAILGRYATAAKQSGGKEQGVSANEDLMREHGVLRRTLLAYFLAAAKLRGNPDSVPPSALNSAARMFRSFGENYHERALEEPFTFPAVKRQGGMLAAYVDTLLEQHRRGREITDYILASTNGSKIGAAEPFARALDSFVLMYQEHSAREDTVVFPAWRKSMSVHDYDEMGEKFEDIEHKRFGKDGFDAAVKQISEIEASLGLADLSQFTAPAPPKQR